MRAKEEGLVLNKAKCALFAPGGITEKELLDHPSLEGVPVTTEGAWVLGSFVGREEFIQSVIDGKVEEFTRERMDRFYQLCDCAFQVEASLDPRCFTQKLVQLLRFCHAPAMAYTWRTTRPTMSKRNTWVADAAVAKGFVCATTHPNERNKGSTGAFLHQLNQQQPHPDNIHFQGIFWRQGGVGVFSPGNGDTCPLWPMAHRSLTWF